MDTMEQITSQYKDTNDFLAKHGSTKTGQNDSKIFTHTRIRNTETSTYGGVFDIADDKLGEFYRLYCDSVFVKNQPMHMTEKQLDGFRPVMVDLDFRYSYDTTERQHTEEHVADLIQVYIEEIKQMLTFENNDTFSVYVMEKPSVNRVSDKQITKDGIHMIIGLNMDTALQQMLRTRVLKELPDVWDLPLTNAWTDVLDEGISKGITNWQLYGSCKPGCGVYKLTYHTEVKWSDETSDFVLKPRNIAEFDAVRDFVKLTARTRTHPTFAMNTTVQAEYDAALSAISKPARKTGTRTSSGLVFDNDDADDTVIRYKDIVDADTLKRVMDNILDGLDMNNNSVREVHEYTQILPDKYYRPGSHLLNRMVAFALKHTDEKLFLSWVMLRSKATDFDFGSIPALYAEWKKFDRRRAGVTKRSIMYWAKQDAFDDYQIVKKNTIDSYIEATLVDAGDWDYAQVLYHMFKDKYVCTSINTKKWFVFEKHRWEKDEGQSLRLAISKELFHLYSDKQTQYLQQCQQVEPNGNAHDAMQTKIRKISVICTKLKKTNDKNNIMREAMEIFFDKYFAKHMDANPYLLCFTNGVFDFKTKEFRQGYPQDYITKTTNIAYSPYNYQDSPEISDQLTTFMKQLFPLPGMCKYMWEHLSSCLIGVKKEQTFNIYRGSGSNGKSMLAELMTRCLGEYKGTVPITLVTEKRNAIGGTSSEVIQLKGVRYAVMQEPSVGAVINEGILKELTGGDPIQARALYAESEVFTPQFSLVVCTNALFNIKSNDDGTWRRMKLVDFVSKFIGAGESHTDDTAHIFPKDKGIIEKLATWAPVFISMLVKKACETDGEVVDAPEIIAASNKYRHSQDCIGGFIDEKLCKQEGEMLGVRVLNNVFKEWFQINYGNRRPPRLAELEEIMAKKFGPKVEGKWANIKVVAYDDGANALEAAM